MILQCEFPNVHSAAMAVHRFYQDAAGSVALTARPYNRFEPVHSTWWLVPTTAWPAYPHGKLIFHSLDSDGSTLLFVGFHVEKGYGSLVARVDARYRSEVLRPDWLWPDWLADLKGGAVAQAVDEVNRKAGTPVRLAISATYYRDREPGDPYEPASQSDQVLFEARGPDLVLVQRQRGADLLQDVAQSWTLAELGNALEKAPNQEWAWFSATCGLAFRMAPLKPGAPPADAWDAAQLWERVLAPWLPWVR